MSGPCPDCGHLQGEIEKAERALNHEVFVGDKARAERDAAEARADRLADAARAAGRRLDKTGSPADQALADAIHAALAAQP